MFDPVVRWITGETEQMLEGSASETGGRKTLRAVVSSTDVRSAQSWQAQRLLLGAQVTLARCLRKSNSSYRQESADLRKAPNPVSALSQH